jgi:putative PIN family toxin of toxin-antitoxin system
MVVAGSARYAYLCGMNPPIAVVLDTNVIVSGLRSNAGASFGILRLLGDPRMRVHLSVPLVYEYEDVLKRPWIGLPFSEQDVDDFLDSICAVGRRHEIHYFWRPQLSDPGDELVLEAAIAGGCRYIVTHNVRDFVGAERFGIHAITPGEFLRILGEVP